MESFPGSSLLCTSTWRLAACTRDTAGRFWAVTSWWNYSWRHGQDSPLTCPLAMGTQVPPAFSSLLMNSVRLGQAQALNCPCCKGIVQAWGPRARTHLLKQNRGFSSLHYTIWQHKSIEPVQVSQNFSLQCRQHGWEWEWTDKCNCCCCVTSTCSSLELPFETGKWTESHSLSSCPLLTLPAYRNLLVARSESTFAHSQWLPADHKDAGV